MGGRKEKLVAFLFKHVKSTIKLFTEFLMLAMF